MLIEDDLTLIKYCNLISKEQVIALDTEFMRSNTFYPKVSLVQIATHNLTCAIDMQAGLDYQPLKNLLMRENILKVIHSSRQDLEVIYNKFGFIIKNTFDTQVAALFLGYKDSASFETLVIDFLGKTICKKLQFSNWLARPLSASQLGYALSDSSMLFELFYVISKKLDQRFEWVKIESNIIVNPKELILSPISQLLRMQNQIHKLEDLVIAYRIILWRENKVKALDLPRSHLLKNESLIDISCRRPLSLEKLNDRRFNLSRMSLEDKQELLDVILVPIDEQQVDFVAQQVRINKKPIVSKNDLYYMLRILLSIISEKENILDTLIASSDDLVNFSNNLPSKINQNWRYEIFGKMALSLLNGEITIGCKNNSFFISQM